MKEIYNVYIIESNRHYQGISLVAAKSIKEANEIIENFKAVDDSNIGDSWGYSTVDESCLVEDIYSIKSGIIYYGIAYKG